MPFATVEAFKAAADKNPLRIKEAKEAGRRIAGMYCLYTPMEVIMAADAIPVMLCGTRQDPIPTAEKTLPRTLCPLIKSSFGFGLEETCPYFNAADIVVADTTCDGKKKMFEQMAAFKPLHLLHLPHNPTLPEALRFWTSEVARLKERLEMFYGIEITEADLERAIALANRERDALDGLQRLMALKPAPLSGMLMLELLFKSGFFPDKEESSALMEAMVAEVSAAGPGQEPEGPRVLLSGVPMGMGSHKVVKLLEDAGARVVGFENCTGYKRVQRVATDRPPLEAIAARYLATPCSVMTPNTARLELLAEMIDLFQADAVVDLAWHGCHTYAIEQHTVRTFMQERGMPYLALETDYSEADAEQLRVRIEAFLEMQTVAG
ncbi:MAG: 2-hydroxyacyl-CoA dehydratase family protein [Desulfovibrio sp.]|nr:2-hydroxyacyl-CoA dehydratase family protein [Desulfovibrio sp.]MCA1984900.1 2-hydroxyacyl-CoA dehydratase family protein [Desulfovibrio sp.]